MATVKGRRTAKPFIILDDGTKFFGKKSKKEKSTEEPFSLLGSVRRSVARTRKAKIDKQVKDALTATEKRRK